MNRALAQEREKRRARDPLLIEKIKTQLVSRGYKPSRANIDVIYGNAEAAFNGDEFMGDLFAVHEGRLKRGRATHRTPKPEGAPAKAAPQVYFKTDKDGNHISAKTGEKLKVSPYYKADPQKLRPGFHHLNVEQFRAMRVKAMEDKNEKLTQKENKIKARADQREKNKRELTMKHPIRKA